MERSTRRRIGAGVAVLSVIVAGASLWYWRFEGFSPVDALYQTVITISTVGFGEIEELSEGGRIFTMVVILAGAGTTAYTLLALFEYFAEERLETSRRRRMERSAERMVDHMIVCGYGRVGSRVARDAAGQGVVVVENRGEAADAADDAGLVVVRGDATEEGVLERAGIAEAAVLVVALSSDAENLYVVMSARSLNPELQIVARTQSEQSAAKMLRAGADRVVNTEEIGASRLFAVATRPVASEFVDEMLHDGRAEFALDEATIGSESNLAGRTLGEAALRTRTGAAVLALRDPDGAYLTNPGEEAVLEPGWTAVALGTRDQLRRLRGQLDPERVHRQEMRRTRGR